MKDGKMRNPLCKRIIRELKRDWKKYLVVALFLILAIGFVSGMYVANGSMMQAAAVGKEKYHLEDGHFELDRKADQELIRAIETGEKADVKHFYPDQAKMELDDSEFSAVPVTVYENFYRNEDEDHDDDGKSDGTIRVYERTEEINQACLMEGSFPVTEDEIAVDRMHADNAGIQVGDTITVSGQSYHVTGLIAYVNYSTLHEKSTDLMFDALKFNVAMVTKDGFGRLSGTIHYTYAWKYEQRSIDEIEEKKQSDDFMKALLTQTVVHENELQDYVPRYANPAINFATDDMGSDEAMGGVLLDILIVIIAFIFAVTISNTIMKESQMIGTLRASGYTKDELVRHYLATPTSSSAPPASSGLIRRSTPDSSYPRFALSICSSPSSPLSRISVIIFRDGI